MINCDEATTICDKTQYGEVTTWDKIRLSFHLMLCKHCATYSKQNNILSKVLKKHLNTCDSSNHLSEEEKVNLKEKLHKELDH